MDFEQFFHEQLAGLCREYGLKTTKWWDRVYALVGSDFIIMFAGDVSGVVFLEYIRRDPYGKIKCWDIGWYIGTSAEAQDRKNLLPGNTIADRWKNNTLVDVRVLKRRFSDLLSGGDRWMEDYFKSEYAFAPRELFGDDLKKAEQYI